MKVARRNNETITVHKKKNRIQAEPNLKLKPAFKNNPKILSKFTVTRILSLPN